MVMEKEEKVHSYNLQLNFRNREKFCVSKISLDPYGEREKSKFHSISRDGKREKNQNFARFPVMGKERKSKISLDFP